jgi:predicted DNA-binding transcriptional regulator AlpA
MSNGLSTSTNDRMDPVTANSPNETQELLTIDEAAAIVRAPVATLRYWRHLGTGPRSFRLGRRVVYRTDDLHDWIQTRRDAAG